MRYLVLRFDAPLMSFGAVAVDELRPTDILPGASMVTGLLANALGYCFTDAERLNRLQERLVLGARLDVPGTELRDYQTAQLSKKDMLWRTDGRGPSARAGGDNTYAGPNLRERFYRAGSHVSVVVALKPEAEEPTLDAVAEALRRPFRPLFLGRVSCPPAAPLFRNEWLEAETTRQALELAGLPEKWARPVADAPVPAVWPAGEEDDGAVPGAGSAIRDVTDLRDWRNSVHAGMRTVVRGRVRISTDEAGGRP